MKPVLLFVAIALSHIGYVSSSHAKLNEIGPNSPRLKGSIKLHINSKISIKKYLITFLISLYIRRLFGKNVKPKMLHRIVK